MSSPEVIETIEKSTIFGQILTNTCPANIVDFIDGKWSTCPCSTGAKKREGCDHYGMFEYDLCCVNFYVVAKFTNDNMINIYYRGYEIPM